MKLSQSQVDELVRILKDESVSEKDRASAKETLDKAEKPEIVVPKQEEKPKYKWVNGARVRVKE